MNFRLPKNFRLYTTSRRQQIDSNPNDPWMSIAQPNSETSLATVIGDAVRLAGDYDTAYDILRTQLAIQKELESVKAIEHLMELQISDHLAREIYNIAADAGGPDAGWEDEDYVVETD